MTRKYNLIKLSMQNISYKIIHLSGFKTAHLHDMLIINMLQDFSDTTRLFGRVHYILTVTQRSLDSKNGVFASHIHK